LHVEGDFCDGEENVVCQVLSGKKKMISEERGEKRRDMIYSFAKLFEEGFEVF